MFKSFLRQNLIFSLFGPFSRAGKGLWDELLGVGQFYNDLSVQVLRDESEGWLKMMKRFREYLPTFASGSWWLVVVVVVALVSMTNMMNIMMNMNLNKHMDMIPPLA